MRVFAEAFRAVEQNKVILGLYIVLSAGVHGFFIAAMTVLAKVAGTPFPRWAIATYLITGIVACAAFASLQAVVLARLGRILDRPLWKVKTDREALQRFFMPWFLFQLAIFMSVELHKRLVASGTADLLMAALLLMAASVPVCACIMFHGRFVWRELGVALAPLLHRLPEALLVLLAGLVEAVLVLYMVENQYYGRGVWVIADIVEAYFHCLLFAATWFICMAHRRDQEEEESGFDF